jgi:hypothetical protein
MLLDSWFMDAGGVSPSSYNFQEFDGLHQNAAMMLEA